MVEFLIMVMTPACGVDGRAEGVALRTPEGVGVCPVLGVDARTDFAGLPSWMRKAHFYDLAKEWETLSGFLMSAAPRPRVPSWPRLRRTLSRGRPSTDSL